MDAAEFGFQRAEQRVVVQPVRMFVTEAFEIVLQVLAGAGAVIGPYNIEQVVLEGDDDVVVDGCGREGKAPAIAGPQQLVLDQ